MVEEIRTNIVPVNPENMPVEDPAEFPETPPAEQTEDMDPDSYGEKLAADAVQFLQEEFQDHLNAKFFIRFWKEVKTRMPELELPTQTESPAIKKLTKEQKAKVAQMEIPWGQYAGQKVQMILKKDRKALEKMAKSRLPFQLKLEAFLDG